MVEAVSLPVNGFRSRPPSFGHIRPRESVDIGLDAQRVGIQLTPIGGLLSEAAHWYYEPNQTEQSEFIFLPTHENASSCRFFGRNRHSIAAESIFLISALNLNAAERGALPFGGPRFRVTWRPLRFRGRAGPSYPPGSNLPCNRRTRLPASREPLASGRRLAVSRV